MSLTQADFAILNVFRSNKFSSAAFISAITKFSEQDVTESINRLVSKNYLYQSVGGLPKRYSFIGEKEQKNEENKNRY